MQATIHSADFGAMDTERGAAIQRRLDDLGITDREFHTKTGIDRKTLRRAVSGAATTRPSTYAAIESALDKLEAKMRGEGAPSPLGPEFIEFDVSGEGGFHVIVKGPVRDAALLREQVTAIIREIRTKDPDDD